MAMLDYSVACMIMDFIHDHADNMLGNNNIIVTQIEGVTCSYEQNKQSPRERIDLVYETPGQSDFVVIIVNDYHKKVEDVICNNNGFNVCMVPVLYHANQYKSKVMPTLDL